MEALSGKGAPCFDGFLLSSSMKTWVLMALGICRYSALHCSIRNRIKYSHNFINNFFCNLKPIVGACITRTSAFHSGSL